MNDSIPEPWLRGPLLAVHPLLMPVLHALMQAKEDLHKYTEALDENHIWMRPYDLTPLGFHLRHIAGSLDRLTSYMEGRPMHEDQLAFLREELQPGASLLTLLDDVDAAIETASEAVRSLDVTRLTEARSVGRKQLPTTVIGLATHIAEHTQRHVGQAITTCLLLKSL
jgi:hypothetical protein